MRIAIDCAPREARRLLAGLLLFEVLLVLMYLATNAWFVTFPWGPAPHLFDLNRESAVPTWFSSVQLFTIALVLLVTASNNRAHRLRPTTLPLAGSAGFLFLSMDEVAMVHEQITEVAKYRHYDSLLWFGNDGAWIAIYAVIGIPVAAWVAWQLRRLWPHFRHAFVMGVIGAMILVGGAVGLELIGYALRAALGNFPRWEIAAEEFMEMAGASVMLYAALLFSARLRETG